MSGTVSIIGQSTLVGLTREYWPLAGEREGGDGESCAPYFDRLYEAAGRILTADGLGPKFDGRTRAGRRRRLLWYVLLVMGHNYGEPDESWWASFDCLVSMFPNEGAAREGVACWMRHGVLELHHRGGGR